jgi:hypothetical protein
MAKQDSVSIATLCARWWCSLNHWEWPEDWGKPPGEFARLQMLEAEECFLEFNRLEYNKLMDALELVAGRKECLRVHNVENRQAMTNEQFEEFWTNSCESFSWEERGRWRTS